MALSASQLVQQAGFVRVVDGFTGSGQGQAINQYGQEFENSEGRKPTYHAAVTAFTPQATPQDFFVLTGSPLVVARLLLVEVYYAATAAAAFEVALNFNSAPVTGGTPATVANGPSDPNDAAAACVVTTYASGAPTAGTKAFTIRSGRVVGGTVTGGGSGILPIYWQFGITNDKCPVLRNASQQIVLNGLGAALPSGSVFEVRFCWSEESLTGN